MANVIIKSEERNRAEAFVAHSFHADMQKNADREYVECIAARTQQALDELKRMEDKNK